MDILGRRYSCETKELNVAIKKLIMGPPSVKYRGIFLTTKMGFETLAAGNMDTDIGDIGPRSYARIFELMLRLKANYIWPAMHPCTKAFYYIKKKILKVAAQYNIVPRLKSTVNRCFFA